MLSENPVPDSTPTKDVNLGCLRAWCRDVGWEVRKHGVRRELGNQFRMGPGIFADVGGVGEAFGARAEEACV